MKTADDKLIRVERLLNLDPQSQLIASIMSKKLAVGSKFILIDIPFGEGAKVTKSQALVLKKKFKGIAKHFKLHVEIILTDGSQPIGNGIGPLLEAEDVMAVLRNDPLAPEDLRKKSWRFSCQAYDYRNISELYCQSVENFSPI